MRKFKQENWKVVWFILDTRWVINMSNKYKVDAHRQAGVVHPKSINRWDSVIPTWNNLIKQKVVFCLFKICDRIDDYTWLYVPGMHLMDFISRSIQVSR